MSFFIYIRDIWNFNMAPKIEAFKSLMSFVSGSHLGLKGGIKAQRDLITATGEELRMFLQGYKGKHISAEEIESFYRERFPQMDLKIKSERSGSFLDGIFGGAVATAISCCIACATVSR